MGRGRRWRSGRALLLWEIEMSEDDAYKHGIWGANFKIAMTSLRDAWAALERALEPELRKKTMKLGKEVLAAASKKLPDNLYKQLVASNGAYQDNTEGTV